MKNLKIVVMLLLVFINVFITACSKDRNNNKSNSDTWAYAPNYCFKGNYNQFNQRYRLEATSNGLQCIDVQSATTVNRNLCNNFNNNFSFDPRCYYAGFNNHFMNGPFNFNSNACFIYNNGVEVFYPIYYPNLGTTLCVGYSAFQANFYNYNFGGQFLNPIFYNGYSNVYYGCTASFTNCRCNFLGGQLGWFHAGIQLGVCY